MRFAGQCIVEVLDDGIDGILVDDLTVIGEHPNVYDDLEPKIDDLKNDEEIKNLPKGLYNVFFCGQYIWEAYEHWEFGTEYEISVTEWNIVVSTLRVGA